MNYRRGTTLRIWGGEFGRTPFLQGKIADKPRWGRDHHPYGFTVWMAGGETKGEPESVETIRFLFKQHFSQVK